MKDWKNEFNNMLKKALMSKDMVRANVIRMIKTDLTNHEIANNREELTEEQVDKVLLHAAKQRRESIEEFKKAEKLDRASEEEKELKILMEFLPEQMDAKELKKIINETAKELKPEGMKDFGKFMGAVMGKVKGKADGKMVQELVKKQLE